MVGFFITFYKQDCHQSHSTTGTKTRILEKHIDTKNVKNLLAYEMKQSS